MICCYKEELEQDDNKDLNSHLSQSNFYNNKYYQNLLSSNLQQQEQQKQLLTLFGQEYFALLRKTFKNIFIAGDIKTNRLQDELIDYILQRCIQIGNNLQIFIPYSDDEELLNIFQNIKKFKITTIDDNVYYLENLKDKKFIKNIIMLEQKIIKNEFDIVILNCSDLNYKRVLDEMNWISKCSKTFALIFDYNERIEQLISQFMQFILQIKGELLLISLNGQNKFYILFFGAISATKNFSENATIINFLIQDLPDQSIYIKPVQQLLQNLKDKNIPKQQILQMIQKCQVQSNDEFQQPDTQISIFIYWLLTYKIIDSDKIKEIFGNLYISHQLSLTAQLQQLSLTLNNFTLEPLIEDKTRQTIRSQQHTISTIKGIIDND